VVTPPTFADPRPSIISRRGPRPAGNYFVTSTSQNDIQAACARTKAYYKINDNFTAGYAATQSAGYNDIILSNGACLYPND
jgi:hypothetical protein